MRSIAFYLPQFHPIPENDEWWGRGFTEWTNVTKAKPLFKGHYQPHLPADLGFYDLRLPELREAQADLARRFGVDAFCYYHYWFNGRRLLDRPFREVLASGRPDFPFMLCWANENWTRVWDGGGALILLEQAYSEDDDREHLKALVSAFKDPRYVKVEGKPVFLVYRVADLPDPKRTAAIWREEAERAGLPGIYLCRVERMPPDHADPAEIGFDAGVEFQPDHMRVGGFVTGSTGARILRRIVRPEHPFRHNQIYSYDDLVERSLAQPQPGYVRFPCVTPSWDNSSRRKQWATIFVGSTPEKYGGWLEQTLRRFQPCSSDADLVFTNAWNEWAEGNHLEPDQRWGLGYLEAHLAARVRARDAICSRGQGVASVERHSGRCVG